MSTISERKRPGLRRSAILSAAMAALFLTSGLAMSEARADDNSESGIVPEAITDGWITTKVKSQLLVDQEVSGFDISVETSDRVVYLSGEVEDQSQVSHAVEIAEETEGVERVVSTELRLATAVDQARDAVGMSDDD